MNHALASPFELRVLDGEQRGASVPVRPGVALEVSGQWASDVVLRSPAAAEAEVQLVLQDEAVAVHVRRGRVEIGGQMLAAGGRANVGCYTPIRIGDTTVALGEMGAGAWAGLFDLGPDGQAAAAEHAATQAQRAATAGAASAQRRRPAWPRRLIVGGGALAAASLSMLALALAVSPQPQTPDQRAHRAQALLHGAGLTGLSVKASAQGELVASGYLDTQAQRVKAEQVLAADGVPVRMSLWVNEQVVSAAQDVYRVNGLSAEVQAAGPGIVRVTTNTPDLLALQRIEATVRRDVPGLVQLDLRNRLPPRGPSPVPQIDDPGKRIASVVSAETPYVVTADGARYFVGALLPTGHRIESIEPERVLLEREGERSSLQF